MIPKLAQPLQKFSNALPDCLVGFRAVGIHKKENGGSVPFKIGHNHAKISPLSTNFIIYAPVTDHPGSAPMDQVFIISYKICHFRICQISQKIMSLYTRKIK